MNVTVVIGISIHVPIAGNDLTCIHIGNNLYFNPRSHCRERQARHQDALYDRCISIHVPIAGNDPFLLKPDMWFCYFNPRSHCRERLNDTVAPACQYAFQSTFPLQGTTPGHIRSQGRDIISIHVPIAGNDRLR